MAYQDISEQQPFWNDKEIEVGAVLEGKVKLFKDARDDKSSPTMLVEQADGVVKNVWLQAMLFNTISGVVNEGDKIRLTYKGKSTGKDGKQFHDYKVELYR